MNWGDRVDRLLYDGERVECRVELGNGEFVVTTHRVLAFTPRGGGPSYRHADLPNVGDVSLETGGRLRPLLFSVVSMVLGTGLLATSAAVSFVDLVALPDLEPDGAQPAANPAGDAASDVVGTVETALALVDLAVLAVGTLSIGIGVAFALLYLRSRSRRLVLEIRGQDDIELAVSEGDDAGSAVLALEEAPHLGPSPGGIGTGGGGLGPDESIDSGSGVGEDESIGGFDSDRVDDEGDADRLDSEPADARFEGDREEST
ncbi:hypothetical protein [Natrarchaeobius chitinivorans]|uniref:Uncharacterized protein n=1 Tax=Natrarchaeobius chitinivorans TaxID=1679083 RepID=A0A3N6LWT1_NATCH|nr:hypothetical protein [Natrarchaeobius chitinivorans]RQG95153.1 hypothetical protein EA473_09395 [Natrarchaeobius chitinivorans]